MYESYYSFSGMPFQLTPDSRFYFGSRQHSKAMAFLQYGLSQREGFVVVTGEIGAGKTTLVEQLLATLDSREYVAARVVTTQLDGYDTLCMIGAAFGVYREGMDKAALIARLGQFFTETHAQQKHPLVIIDEAQSLTLEAVEELRMLSNLTLGSRAPFQGIFLGQPEFRVALATPELQQLRQRVVASCHLGALNAEDSRNYIEHRLKLVGWTDDPGVSDGAFEEIYRHTGGIPRRINTLFSRLLLLGYIEERHAIDAPSVVSVAQEIADELGPAGTLRSQPQSQSDAPLGAGSANGEYLSRLVNLERRSAKHDRAIMRVLDLALKYLPAQSAS
ncbi:MAG: XrtA/PEP-CTERM system-associated ATPase [Rhizomicrobium sp.]